MIKGKEETYYKVENMDFYEAWWFLFNHKIYKDKHGNSRFLECTDITVVKVNPENNTIKDDNKLNTKTQVWLETGSWSDDLNSGYYDIELDCGGDTYEEAIIRLADLVKMTDR